MEIYQKRNIVGHVKALAPVFEANLAQLAEHPLAGECRGLGLLGALDLSPDKTSDGFATIGKVGARMAAELVDRGLIVRAVVDSIVFCPPMIITADELDEMFAPIKDALDATMDWAKAEGFL